MRNFNGVITSEMYWVIGWNFYVLSIEKIIWVLVKPFK